MFEIYVRIVLVLLGIILGIMINRYLMIDEELEEMKTELEQMEEELK